MNWLDIVIIICLAVGLITGLFDGFVRQVVSFIGLLFAIFFAKQLTNLIRIFLYKFDIFREMDGAILTAVCYIVAFVAIIVAIAIVANLVHFAVKMTPAKALNSILGGLFGILIWAFSLSIVLNLISAFDKQSALIGKQTQNQSVLYTRVKSVVPTVFPSFNNYFK